MQVLRKLLWLEFRLLALTFPPLRAYAMHGAQGERCIRSASSAFVCSGRASSSASMSSSRRDGLAGLNEYQATQVLKVLSCLCGLQAAAAAKAPPPPWPLADEMSDSRSLWRSRRSLPLTVRRSPSPRRTRRGPVGFEDPAVNFAPLVRAKKPPPPLPPADYDEPVIQATITASTEPRRVV